MANPLATLTGDLVLVGCGKMGGAMLAGWLAGGLAPARVRVVGRRSRAARLAGAGGRGAAAPIAAAAAHWRAARARRPAMDAEGT